MKKGNNDYLEPIVSNVDPDMSREALMSYMHDYPDFMDAPFKCKSNFRGDTLQSCGWTFGVHWPASHAYLSSSRPVKNLFSKM